MSEPFINIDIDLGPKTVNLQIDREEEIESTLKDFCEFYNLDARVHQTIMEQIIHNINSAANHSDSGEVCYDEQSDDKTMNSEDRRMKEMQRKWENPNLVNNDSSHLPDLPGKQKDKLNYTDWKIVQQQKETQSPLTPSRKNDLDRTLPTNISTTLNPRKDFRGLFLYNRYLDKKEIKANHAQHIKEIQLAQEVKEATFQPKLDYKSMRMAERILDPETKVEERLIKYGKESNFKNLKLKTKQTIKENDFKYQPEINGKSSILSSIVKKKRDNLIKEKHNKTFDGTDEEKKQIGEQDLSFDESKCKLKASKSKDKSPKDKGRMNKKTSFVSSDKQSFTNMQKKEEKSTVANKTFNSSAGSFIHDYLYEDSRIKKEKLEQHQKKWMDENCTFKPYVSQASRSLIQRDETMDEFIKRLMTSKKETEELLVEIRKTKENSQKADFNKQTKTEVGKIDRGINLDSYYDKKLLQSKNKIQSEELVNNLEKKKHWLENSMKIVLKMKIEKYKEIFDLLDHDKDGQISAKSIKLSNISTDLLETLTPLLEEIQTKSLTLSFKDFCIMGDKILKNKIFIESN